MEFISIASSSAGNCYILRSEGLPTLLLDAGVRFEEIQRGLDFRLSEVAGVLLTHAHGDHSKAIPKLLTNAVDVYASQEALTELSATKNFRAIPVKPHEQFRIGSWTVLPFSAVHDSPGTLGFVIGDGQGSTALYLTDSAYSPFRFENLTHIFIECNFSREIMRENLKRGTVDGGRAKRTTQNHMSLETLIDMLKANDLSRVEEIHLLHLSDENSDAERMANAVREATGCPTYVAEKRVSA